MSRPGRLAAALAGAALLASCGDGGGISVEDDRESVERAIAVFEESLKEDGFEAAEDAGDDEESDLEFRSEECKEFDAALGDDNLPGSTAEGESDELERGEVTPDGGTADTVEGNVGLVRDSGALDDYMAMLQDERLEGCLEEAVQISLDEADLEGLTLAELDVSRPEAPDIGDEAVRLRVDGLFEIEGIQVPFVFVFDFAVDGRAAAVVSTTTTNADEPTVDTEALVRQLIEEVA